MDFVRPIESIIPGAQGRLLAALARVDSPLTLRGLAGTSKVSLAQASRLLPGLVRLGLVERQDVPPAALFRLEKRHVVSSLVLRLEQVQAIAIRHQAREAGKIEPPPESMILFGPLAQGTARAESDIDVLLVRGSTLPDDDGRWRTSVDQWVANVRAVTGNEISLLELGLAEATSRLRSKRSVWKSIAEDGIVLFGRSPHELMEADGA